MNRKMLVLISGVLLFVCAITVNANNNPMTQLKLWFNAEWNQKLESFNTEMHNGQAESFGELELVFENFLSELSLEEKKELQIELSEKKISEHSARLNQQIHETADDLMHKELEVDKREILEEFEKEIISAINNAFAN